MARACAAEREYAWNWRRWPDHNQRRRLQSERILHSDSSAKRHRDAERYRLLRGRGNKYCRLLISFGLCECESNGRSANRKLRLARRSKHRHGHSADKVRDLGELHEALGVESRAQHRRQQHCPECLRSAIESSDFEHPLAVRIIAFLRFRFTLAAPFVRVSPRPNPALRAQFGRCRSAGIFRHFK